MNERNILWRALAWPGMEHLRLTETETGYVADGLILAGDDGAPFRLHYRVDLDAGWRFRRLQLFDPYAHHNPERGRLLRELALDDAGHWAHQGFDLLPGLSGCIDIDLTATPFTNTLPIRRLNLAEGESTEIAVAWIHVPELVIENARQRYILLETMDSGSRYRFEGLDSGFVADITVDDAGLVVDYPGLFERG